MAEIKVTNATSMAHAIEVLENVGGFPADEMAKLVKIKESFEKKSLSKADLEKQKENEAIESAIMDIFLADSTKRLTITEIVSTVGYSTSRITARCGHLIDLGKLQRNVEKGKALYSIA